MYPTLVRGTVSQMACRNDLMDGVSESYLYADLEISCNSGEHIAFFICFALPCLIIFVIGVPICSIIALGRAIKTKGFHDDTTMYRYAILVGGYSEQHWYWSLVVTARKFAMAFITIALVPKGVKVQYLSA